ncbi:MAG: hypothetical protein GY861_23285 [bacterium]|nr:hypothetical protein [bacterium]
MFYIEWMEKEIEGLGMYRLITEVNPNGTVLREVGLDTSGNVIHKTPTAQKNYGLFDLQKIETNNLHSTLSTEEFEKLWHLPLYPNTSRS